MEVGDPRLETVPPLFAGERGGFLDPCGDSRWLLSGERVFGPAPRGLDRFPLAEGGSALLIDLGRVLLGACSDGTSAERCSDFGLPVVESGPPALRPRLLASRRQGFGARCDLHGRW